MKQLIRLKDVSLFKYSVVITADGDRQETATKIGDYKVIIQELSDSVDATIYGSNINKMVRISSVRDLLEKYLRPKLNNTDDNISMYKIHYTNDAGINKFKIISVKEKYIDCEREE